MKIPTVNKQLPVSLLGTELCIPLKIFAGLSKHLPVFLLGTENVMGWWVTKSKKVKKSKKSKKSFKKVKKKSKKKVKWGKKK